MKKVEFLPKKAIDGVLVGGPGCVAWLASPRRPPVRTACTYMQPDLQ